jgi:hypothetical protein
MSIDENSKVTGVGYMKGIAGVAAIVVVVIGGIVFAVRMTAAASAAPLPLAYGFEGSTGWQRGEVRPHAIDFGTGGNLLVRGLAWSGWTQQAATASGVRWSYGCTPNCAAGTYSRTSATLALSDVRIHDGVRYFALLTMRWSSGGRMQREVFRWSPGLVPGAQPFWS